MSGESLRRVREICPKCGSSYVIKYGRFMLKGKALQKYRCKDCKYVWYESIPEKIPQRAYELILKMLRAFIRDMDLRKDLNAAGWLPLNEEDIRLIQELDFCEVDYENMRGRINPFSELPEDLLSTDEGLIFSDYIKSTNIIEEIRKTCKNEEEYRYAIVNGLKLMFQRAKYTFWEKEEGVMPSEVCSLVLSPQWVRASEVFANLLVKNLITSIYGSSSLLSTNESTTGKENYGLLKILNGIKPQFTKIVEYFSKRPELIEFLGLVWFAFKKVEEDKIDYLGARILVLDEVIKIMATKKSIDEDKLRNELKEMSENLDELIEGEPWGLSWGDVFIVPW